MTIEEELVFFEFELTRGFSPQRAYRSLLERIFFQNEHHPNIDNLKAVSIALVAHTRDIVSGKGECTLFYQLMEVLILLSDDHPFFINFVKELVTKCVIPVDRKPPYGSWKDIKYLLNHLRDVYGETQLVSKPIFEFIVQLIAYQLLADSKVCDGPVTLAGKWAPREKSAFGWQTPHIVAVCFPTLSPYSGCRAYRKMISAINRRLETVEVFQCSRQWAKINFSKHVTSRTLFRQRKAFSRGSDIDSDRRVCQINFNAHMTKEHQIKTHLVNVGELVREAYIQTKLVDVFWNNRIPPLGLVIPFVDTSASVAGTTKEALYAAIGIGLQIAEKSAFGKRLYTFSSDANWINLEGITKLTEMVSRVQCDELSSNLEHTINLFLENVIESGVNPLTLAHYTLVIISDMNFDNGYNHSKLKGQFQKAGVKVPHIVYWNIASAKKRLDVDITETNVTFISGFQVNAIERIIHKKIDNGNANTAWNKLVNTLCASRYSWVWCVI